MPEHDFGALYAQYPAVIAQMRDTFTSHEFILRLAQHHQQLYIEALYSYRESLHRGGQAPFMIVHGILAKQLLNYPNLIEHVGDVMSFDIFGQQNGCALEDWEEQVREYLADLRAGLESINAPPQNDEEAHQQFQDKRRIMATLVERVHIGKGRKLEVTFKLDVIAAIKQLANFSENWQAGICTCIPDLTNFARVLVTL